MNELVLYEDDSVSFSADGIILTKSVKSTDENERLKKPLYILRIDEVNSYSIKAI